MLHDLVEPIQTLIYGVVVLFALFVAALVVMSLLPRDNPLRAIVEALSYRIGAYLLAGVVAIPVEPIPGLDALYDIAVPIALVWYSVTFFRDAGRIIAASRRPIGRDGRVIKHERR